MTKVSVIGAGAWGTALAIVAKKGGNDVLLWTRHADHADALNREKTNRKYLPNVPLAPGIDATSELTEAGNADILLLVVPAQKSRNILTRLKPSLSTETVLVMCAKGIEQDSGRLMSEVIGDVAPDNPLAILSGPNFAKEIAAGLPAAATLAIKDREIGENLVRAIGLPTFRPYLTDDIIGAQIGGAVKNVLAIACGVVSGGKLGENARAALITRGMAEILRLGEKLGARAETLMGLSGLGDLVLTCSSPASRNFSLGAALGQGDILGEILQQRSAVTEGVYTASAICRLAEKFNIDMPICCAVDEILNGGVAVSSAVEELLARPFRDERLAGF
ncbi:NAD(P)H-dependent glycerol-3-phosphate dehydrogenase [Sneathiella sp.]|uniref:NAD(P)H-dependent glycerol-3-phosphate dehydrogenase n=1 Tax=Sneathiella sp. TaxID=1964365 RepID=UPI002626691E|nr:NAD(P)H-dependent glycerol-3-phosphate dehydrogenase [Sneathiella sp.]MDF2368860.1 NAD(P)-dependent glycerol-3-phosphate dehydrogenase [Sneathiella sp.]